ncbi:hypothetical protein CUJ90_29665 [Paraburkholderia terricola]|nr:hypothetical protein CUJ90_29665 [Paraburkholderia terricola]
MRSLPIVEGPFASDDVIRAEFRVFCGTGCAVLVFFAWRRGFFCGVRGLGFCCWALGFGLWPFLDLLVVY